MLGSDFGRQVDGPSNERCRKEGEEMEAGETTGNGKTGTDGDFFVTVDPRNWKRLKEEEEVNQSKSGHMTWARHVMSI
jgi:hypothetical protein